MDTYRRFNRFEIKYLVHHADAERLKESIAEYVRRDVHNGDHGYYDIASLYYDSPNLACFWDKLDGVKFRRKIRIRRYGRDGAGAAYLEIKQRIDQTLQKKRIAGTYAQFRSSLDRPTRQDSGSEPDAVAQEATFLVRRDQMKPRVLVGYNREAYFGKFEQGLRITFDKNLKYTRYTDGLDLDSRLQHYFLAPQYFVLEIKFNHVVPTWLCASVNRLNLQTRRVSKYCYAMNQMIFDGSIGM
tara:strand:- start:2490 stop:3215 length:726 start_codon:yes stop_codon:yes gene_type:complete